MNPVVMAIVLAVLTAVLFLALRGKPRRDPEPAIKESSLLSTCPLCQSPLQAGERVSSVVYATKTEDKLMEITHCPHCGPRGDQPRRCPVCHKPLRPQDVVTARVFTRATASGPRKTHVHVLGCPQCRR